MTENTNKNEEKTKADLYLDPETKKFKEGNPGGGRPKGSLSLVSILKRELEKNAPGTTEEKRTFAEEFVREILKKVFVEKDVRMMIEVMNRVDGMPKQTLGLDPDDLITEVEVKIKSADEIISQRGRTSDQGLSKEPDGVSLEEEQDNS